MKSNYVLIKLTNGEQVILIPENNCTNQELARSVEYQLKNEIHVSVGTAGVRCDAILSYEVLTSLPIFI